MKPVIACMTLNYVSNAENDKTANKLELINTTVLHTLGKKQQSIILAIFNKFGIS